MLSLGPLTTFIFLVLSILFAWLAFGVTLAKVRLSKRVKRHIPIFLILFVFGLILSIPNFGFDGFDDKLRVPTVRGLLQWSVFPIGITLMSLNLFQLHRLLDVMLLIAMALLFFSFIYMDYSAIQTQSDDYRRLVFGLMENKSAYNIHLTSSLFIIGLGFIEAALGRLKRGRIIFLIGVSVSVFTALYYGKRATITDLTFAVILWYFAEARLNKKFSIASVLRVSFKFIMAISIILAIISVIFENNIYSYIEQLVARFSVSSSGEMPGSDRLYELSLYWQSLSLLQMIFGAGLAYIYQGPIYDFWHGTHIGWSNLHILGGFLLLFYGLYLAITSSAGYPIKSNNIQAKYFFSSLAILITISLTHSTVIGDITGWTVAFALYGTRLMAISALDGATWQRPVLVRYR